MPKEDIRYKKLAKFATDLGGVVLPEWKASAILFNIEDMNMDSNDATMCNYIIDSLTKFGFHKTHCVRIAQWIKRAEWLDEPV